MRNFIIYLTVIFLLILSACAVKKPIIRMESRIPTITVGLLWGKDSIDFSTERPFDIFSHDGTFIARGIKNSRWRLEVKDSSPAKIVYRLVIGSMSTMKNAEKFYHELKRRGIETEICPFGRSIRVGGRVISDNHFYRVVLKKIFKTKEEAERYSGRISDGLKTFMIRQVVEDAVGTIVVKNVHNGEWFESSKPINIRGADVRIYNIPAGQGYHWEHLEDRTYPETVSFRLGTDGKLVAVNIVSLETYLKGVVPAEMPATFPIEALKAQAIASRGEALAKLGIVHSTDPFDICADVHCQAYTGLNGRSEATDLAVNSTRGLILWKDGKICDAVYSAVCGGHTEDSGRLWNSQPKSYLQGRFDGPSSLSRYGRLDKEENLRRWIDDKPAANCNLINKEVPPSLEYLKKYFRWEVTYSQDELSRIVQEKSGKIVGKILDLIALRRGASGRITVLKIVGTESILIIDNELMIRKTLSKTALWSSCFYVKKINGRDGVPERFVIKGAGFGHGVGMCQTGAAVMALRGSRFYHILKHYYSTAQIKRIY